MTEARKVTRRSSQTTIVWGRLRGKVNLYRSTGGVKEAEFDTFRESRPDPDPEPAADAVITWKTSGEAGDPLNDGSKRGPTQDELYAQFLDVSGLPVGGSGDASAPPPAPRTRKGIYRPDGSFLDLTDRLDAITEVTNLEEMRIIRFVPSVSIPRVLIRDAYYLGMGDGEAGRVLRALEYALGQKRAVALVKWTQVAGQNFGVVAAARKALYVLKLAWPAEMLAPGARVIAHRGIELTEDEKYLACELVGAMMGGPSDVAVVQDDRVAMRAQLRAAAEAGLVEEWEAPAAPRYADGLSLEDALRETLENDTGE